jgi:hypothetical protein
MFTVASDAFPRRAVGSVVGFGSMCGGIGGLFMNLIAGGMLQWLGSYAPLFVFAGVMHPIAWITIRALSGGGLKTVDLDRGLRTAFSPVLLGIGLALALLGAALAAVVGTNWQYILSITKNSAATAAAALSGAGLIALIGLALIYASREQKTVSA